MKMVIGSCVMDWSQYHRLETINNLLEDLVCKFPERCSIHQIGTSAEGREMMVSF